MKVTAFTIEDADELARRLRSAPNLIPDIVERIRVQMDEMDEKLRTVSDESDFRFVQGQRQALKELVEYAHNLANPEPKTIKRRAF